MNIIKLSAINSTNDYLKQMCTVVSPDNFTVIYTENQTGGRGQMGSRWESEPGKNLTFSILVKNVVLNSTDIYTLNVAVCIGIVAVLHKYNIHDVAVKWPNDILAGNKKVGGILIENSFKSNGTIQSVVGIGLNVNQEKFSDLAKAGSLYTVSGKTFDKEILMQDILYAIKDAIGFTKVQPELLWESYLAKLFKKDIPMTFEQNDKKFMGIIKGVSPEGRLQVLLEDDSTQSYGIKEIKMLY